MSYSPEAVLDMQWYAAEEASATEKARRAPHVLMRPHVYPDGNQWCALYGEDLQMGVAGFGDTPEAACADFDKNWCTQKAPPATKEPTEAGEPTNVCKLTECQGKPRCRACLAMDSHDGTAPTEAREASAEGASPISVHKLRDDTAHMEVGARESFIEGVRYAEQHHGIAAAPGMVEEAREASAT
jgi:hypothetical protein